MCNYFGSEGKPILKPSVVHYKQAMQDQPQVFYYVLSSKSAAGLSGLTISMVCCYDFETFVH